MNNLLASNIWSSWENLKAQLYGKVSVWDFAIKTSLSVFTWLLIVYFQDEIENKGAVVFDYMDLISDPGICICHKYHYKSQYMYFYLALSRSVL